MRHDHVAPSRSRRGVSLVAFVARPTGILLHQSYWLVVRQRALSASLFQLGMKSWNCGLNKLINRELRKNY